MWNTFGKYFLSIAPLSYFSIYLGENYNWTLLEVRISKGIFLEETKENTRSRTMGDILLVSSFLAFRCLTWYRIKTNRAGSFEPFILGKTLWLLRDMTINRILWQNQVVKNEILGQKLVDVIGKIPKGSCKYRKKCSFHYQVGLCFNVIDFLYRSFPVLFSIVGKFFSRQTTQLEYTKKVSVSLTKIYFKTQIISLKFNASVNANVPMLKFVIAILTKLNFRCKWRRE